MNTAAVRLVAASLAAVLSSSLVPVTALALTPQVINFTSTAPTDAVVGGPSYTVSATADSGLTVAFTIDAASNDACTLSGTESTVSFLHAGTCTIDADQGGDSTFDPAPQVQQTFTVGKGVQSIVFGSSAPDAAVVDGAPYTPVATGGASGNPVVFSIDPASSAVCSIAGGDVSFDAVGTCTIDADQAGDADYADAAQTQQSFTVGKGAQVIEFTSSPPVGATVGGPTYTVAATGGASGNPVTFSIDASANAVCTVAVDVVSFIGHGGCRINADQAGNDNYNDAVQVQQVVAVDNTAPSCTGGGAIEVVMNVPTSGPGSCTDQDGDGLTFSIADPPSNGTASIDASGTWTYTTSPDSLAADSFTFVANDGVDDSVPVAVSITVRNAPIDARNDTVSIPPVTAKTITVLANDGPGTGDTGQPLRITSVTKPSLGSATITGTTVTYDPRGCSTGLDSFKYTVTDGQFAATKTVYVTILRPGQGGLSTKPITDYPVVGFITNSTMSSTVPMKLSWCGVTTSSTSVRSYKVLQSTNGGSTYPTTLFSATTLKSNTRSLSVSKDYRWKARTVDRLGRIGSYRASPVSRITRIQNTSTRITYTGTWRTHTTSSASGGSERYTSQNGAYAEITVTNVRAFAIVGPKSATRGSFKVFVDGTLVKTVSERASSTAYRRVLYVRGVASGMSHLIRIQCTGTGRIDLDAILTLSGQ